MKRYFPQLDGLRVLAAATILIHHYWPASVRIDWSKGRLGVDLFFAMSGYLITRSLLRRRETSPQAPLSAFKAFQQNRLVRIFPLYYVTLLLAASMPSERHLSLLWHFAFLSNIYFVLQQRFVGAGGHLWALAIEQQFYLFWPLVVLWIARRRMAQAAIAMVAVGVLFRLLGWFQGWSSLTTSVLTPTAFESLGCGAWLATWMETREDRPERAHPVISAIGIVGLLLWLPELIWAEESTPGYVVHLLLTELSRAFLLTWLIAQSVWGIPGWIGSLLQSAPARLLGAWSYGIYLSHNFFLGIYRRVPHHVGSLSLYDSQASLALLTTVAWSAALYYLMERPLNERLSKAQKLARAP
jgi:peptidoglycan/LPS O-acetylase OafA/YrhL